MPKSTTKTAKTSPKVQATPQDGAVVKRKFNAPSQNSVLITMGVAALVLSGGSAAYCVYDFIRGDIPVTVYSSGDGNSRNFTEGSIADVASKVAPGVVSIVTEVGSTNFWGQTSTSTAAGTGMLVTSDGYILTNKHVISGGRNFKVVLDDGTTYSNVEVVATDPLADVAYLKIKDVSGLPTVTLGDSKTITPGQQVIAIGNALGQFQNTITSGIVSGTGRSITASSSDNTTSENLTDMIQTDAAINSGNSGGPLVNAVGEVIGINTATSTNADGIGFAIPISSVKGMLRSITETGSAKRAYMGVYYINITSEVASQYNLPVKAGAYVYAPSQYSPIIKDSPAEKAGLKEKDIIIRVNGINVGASSSVATLLGEYKPGDTVQITVLRDGKEQNLNLTLGEYKAN